jgi:hypothetical protein
MNFQQLSRLIFAGSIEACIPPVFSNRAHCCTFNAYSPHCQRAISVASRRWSKDKESCHTYAQKSGISQSAIGNVLPLTSLETALDFRDTCVRFLRQPQFDR